ncbi:MAG: translation initiation factor IF-1 [Deinococcales bacterium]
MAGRSKPGQNKQNGKESKRQEKAEDVIRTEGVILEALPNTTFMVKLDSGHELLSYVSGKMRMNYIRILPGDRVVLEISKYDPTKGRIVYRK